MKKFIFVFVVISSLLVLNVVSFSPKVLAQTTATPAKNGFSISPPSFDIKANPGDHLSNTIKIENLSDQTLELTAKAQNFVAYGDEGQVNLTDEDSSYSINSWIKFDNPNLEVKVGEIALFNYTLDVPTNAQPGSHYGAVVFSTNPASGAQANAATIVQEIGSIILIRIPGDVVENAGLVTYKTDQNYFTDPKVKLDILLQNTGTVLVKPVGTIDILDIFGNKIQTVTVDGKNILPGSKRVFDTEFDFDKIGFFKAHLNLTYGDTSKTITGDVNFTSLYTQRLIPITLGIVALIAFYIIFRKRINKAISVIVKG